MEAGLVGAARVIGMMVAEKREQNKNYVIEFPN